MPKNKGVPKCSEDQGNVYMLDFVHVCQYVQYQNLVSLKIICEQFLKACTHCSIFKFSFLNPNAIDLAMLKIALHHVLFSARCVLTI